MLGNMLPMSTLAYISNRSELLFLFLTKPQYFNKTCLDLDKYNIVV